MSDTFATDSGHGTCRGITTYDFHPPGNQHMSACLHTEIRRPYRSTAVTLKEKMHKCYLHRDKSKEKSKATRNTTAWTELGQRQINACCRVLWPNFFEYFLLKQRNSKKKKGYFFLFKVRNGCLILHENLSNESIYKINHLNLNWCKNTKRLILSLKCFVDLK